MPVSTSVQRYRVYCQTDATYEYAWGTTTPTACPRNAGHTITPLLTTQVQKIDAFSISNDDSPYAWKKFSIIADTTNDIVVNLKKASLYSSDFVVFVPAGSGTITFNAYGNDTIDGVETPIVYTATGADQAYVWTSDGVSAWTTVVDEDAPPTAFQEEVIEKDDPIVSEAKGSNIAASTQNITNGVAGIASGFTYNPIGGDLQHGQITATLSVASTFTIDGITLNQGQRILLKDQTSAQQNGIWVVSYSGTALTLNRAPDFVSTIVKSGAFMFIEQGTTNAITGWLLNNPGSTVVVGGDESPTALNFVQFTGTAGIAAGDGIDVSGSTVSVDLKANGGLVIESTELALDLGASSITGTLAVGDGGTGATSFTSGNVLVGQGTSAIIATQAAPSGDFVGTTDTQTLTNKTFTDASTFFQDDADNSKKIQFELSGITTSTTQTFTFPDATTTLVGTDTSQTLTNKTLGTGTTLSADLNADSNKITNLGTPTADTDAANKGYVDSIASGLDLKDSVVAATTVDLDSNASISGTATYNNVGGASARGQITATLAVADTFTIDGISFGAAQDGARVLIKNQTNQQANGIYTTTISGTNLTLDRATDFDSDAEVTAGAFTFLEQGSTLAETGWVVTTDDPITVGGASGSNIAWTQFSGVGAVIAGDGIDKVGNTISVDLKANGGLVIESTEIALDLGASSITGTLAVADGGTGATTLTSGNVLIGAGTSAVTTTKVAPGGDFVGTTDVQTLTNKTLVSDTVVFESPTGTDREVALDLSALASDSTTRTLYMSDGDVMLSSVWKFSDIATTGTLASETDWTGLAYNASGGPQSNGQFTATLNVANTLSIDGISYGSATGDPSTGLILVKDQASADENGIYQFTIAGTAITFDRYVSMDENADLSTGAVVYVREGTENKGSLWTLEGIDDTLVVGTSNLTFKDASSGVTAGDGIDITAGVVSADLKANGGLVIESGEIAVDLGASTITGTLAVADGGTGATTLTSGNVLVGNGTGAVLTSQAAPAGDFVGTTDTQTLTNKTFTDASTFFQDDADNSKKIQFELSGITTATTQTFTFPDATTTLVGTDTTQTLTNKTLGASTSLSADLDANSNKIINLATPTADGDAASKGYVDSVATGLDPKESCRLASTVDLDSNASISGTATYTNTGGASGRGQITATLAVSDTFTVDGVSLGAAQDGTRILLKDQATGAANGIWTTTIVGTALTLDRATDFDSDAEVTAGAFTFVEEGTANANIGYVLTTNNPITVGGASGTSLTFTPFSGAGSITAGDGLQQSGNTFSVDLKADGGLVIESGEIAVDLGATTITGTLAVGDGGTGATTLTSGNVLVGNGTGAVVTSQAAPSGDFVGTTDTQTLTNKTFTDASTFFQDDADNSKKIQFELSGITTATTQTFTFPDATTTLVGTDATQTLTNKTLGTSTSLSADLDANSNKIINLATPTVDGDAATKGYVDSVASGLDVKESCRVASTVDLDSNASISGTATYNNTGGASGRGQITATLAVSDTFTVDAVALSSADNGARVLLKDQATGAANGIWTVTIAGTALTLDRATDFDSDAEVTAGAFTFVEEGTASANTGYVLTTNDPIIVGGASGTSLSFSPFSGAGSIVAGDGLQQSGNTFSADLKANGGLVIESGEIAVDLGATTITGTLGVADGGTGATALTSGNVLVGNGTGAVVTSQAAPSGDFVGTTDTQTLTNKTFTDASTFFQDDADNSKKIQFELSGITTATTQTFTFPDATTVLVGTDTTQTLTNKTLGASTSLSADLDANSNKIINLATPTADGDAATKGYVDSVASGLDPKESCRVASTVDLDSNASISGTATYTNTGGASARGQITATLAVSDTFTVDGVSLSSADNGARILLKDQATGAANGIWTVTIAGTALTLDRATDFDSDAEVTAGAFTFIEQGTVSANIGYVLATNDPITIGGASGTSLTFTPFSGAGSITAGDGLEQIGNTFSVDLKANGGLVIESGEIAVDLGATTITGTLAVADGGTGATTLTSGNVLVGNGTGAVVTSQAAPAGDFVGTTDTQTLTNKTFTDASTFFQDDADNSKKVQFQLASVATATTRIWTFPDDDDVFVGVDTTQTLTNKTLTAPVIATIVNTGTLTLPTSTDTLVGRATTDTLTNKTLDDATTLIQDNVDTTKKVRFEVSGVTTGTTRVLTIPDDDAVIVGDDTTQVLTNKTLTDASTLLQDDVDNTKKVRFEVSSVSTATTRVWTFPDDDDVFVGVDTPQTLTNKDLTGNELQSFTNNGATITMPDFTSTPGPSWLFITIGDPYFQTTGITYALTRTIIFPGTNQVGTVTSVDFLTELVDNGTLKARIVDVTNALVICEITNAGTFGSQTIESTSTINNLSATPVIWEIQAARDAVSANKQVRLHHVNVNF